MVLKSSENNRIYKIKDENNKEYILKISEYEKERSNDLNSNNTEVF